MTLINIDGDSDLVISVIDDFPLYCGSYYAQDDTTMEIRGTVNYTYSRSKLWNIIEATSMPSIAMSRSLLSTTELDNYSILKQMELIKPDLHDVHVLSEDFYLSKLNEVDILQSFYVSVRDDMTSDAIYNRTLDHQTYNIGTGQNDQQFTISTSSSDDCYFRYCMS